MAETTTHSKQDAEVDALVSLADQRKHNTQADGMWFIDWYNDATQLLRRKHGGAVADDFNRARPDEGNLVERFDAGVKLLKSVASTGRLPTAKEKAAQEKAEAHAHKGDK